MKWVADKPKDSWDFPTLTVISVLGLGMLILMIISLFVTWTATAESARFLLVFLAMWRLPIYLGGIDER